MRLGRQFHKLHYVVPPCAQPGCSFGEARGPGATPTCGGKPSSLDVMRGRPAQRKWSIPLKEQAGPHHRGCKRKIGQARPTVDFMDMDVAGSGSLQDGELALLSVRMRHNDPQHRTSLPQMLIVGESDDIITKEPVFDAE